MTDEAAEAAPLSAADEAKAAKRRDALAKGRETARRNAEARKAERLAELRKSQIRTSDDVLPMHPTEARRADPAREATLQGTRGDETLPPRRRRDDRTQALEIPNHLKKPGWDYQFVAITVLNQPVDKSNIRDYVDNGQWRPCNDPAIRNHFNADPGSAIEVLGTRLYERPLSYTLQARQEDFNAAEYQRRDKVLAAASGGSTGRGDPGMPNDRTVHRVPLEIQIEEAQGRLGSGR